MPLIPWSDKMSVGNTTIDHDHQNLIHRLNMLHEILRGVRPRGETGVLLRDLITYTEYHFTTEEQIMRLARYPAADAHAQLHESLKQRLGEFYAQYDQNPEDFDLLGLFDFVSEWLMRHILREDKKLGSFLASQKRPYAPQEWRGRGEVRLPSLPDFLPQ
ncbi:bacteriohemerythrin [Pararhodospirillum photometricum]|nr:bacteriohemerythrin [Pararhodospirillum photometricum]